MKRIFLLIISTVCFGLLVGLMLKGMGVAAGLRGYLTGCISMIFYFSMWSIFIENKA